jgi:hypothetical protein
MYVHAPTPVAIRPWFFRFYAVVVAVQGVHVVEHIIQLVQVSVFDVPDDDALGLLGYVFAFHGTEEWLHLVFNVAYLTSLYVLLGPLHRLTKQGVVPAMWFTLFAFGVLLESWHLVEHIVIIRNAISNGGGCPCPGIGDRALDVSDTELHFVYNLFAYAGTLAPFPTVLRTYRLASSNAT